jgi:predicted metal-dependent hydrolase
MDKQARINDSTINYEVVHRNIKYPRLEFKTGRLLLILPDNYKDYNNIINKHKDWIHKQSSRIAKALEEAQNKRHELRRTDEEFKKLLCSFVEDISFELKININNIYFRRMKSKWGSCSRNKNLTINTLLKYLPDNLIEYVIFHEMVHLIERKHNYNFWKIIAIKFDNYEENETKLFEYWFLIQEKIKSIHSEGNMYNNLPHTTK